MLDTIEVTYDKWNDPLEVFLDGQLLSKVDADNSPTGKYGMRKTVFMAEKYVIKFGSLTEAEMEIDEEDQPFFAMVVYADINKRWYIQERVDCAPFAEVTGSDLDIALELADKYGFDDIDFCYRSIQNKKFGHNFTKDRFGQMKIYDYEGTD